MMTTKVDANPDLTQTFLRGDASDDSSLRISTAKSRYVVDLLHLHDPEFHHI